MKPKYFLAFLLLLSCSLQRKHSAVINKQASYNLHDKYRVTRIDSINNVYVIYAKQGLQWYKIVSLKDSASCKNIYVGGEYMFRLISKVPHAINGIDAVPSTIPHINGISFNGSWIKFERDSIRDIFISMNIRGLCLQEY